MSSKCIEVKSEKSAKVVVDRIETEEKLAKLKCSSTAAFATQDINILD